MEFHEAANAFPLLDDDRLEELAEDIRQRGQMEPITICEGKILDGRNRYMACLLANVKPKTREYDGDPWSFAWSLNGQRRDLVAEQRYLIWKFCNEHSEQWESEKKKIADEANAKRSAATKEQHQVSNPRSGETMVVQHSVALPDESEVRHKANHSKAVASKTNPGAVARGDKLAKDRPDLAAKVRTGELKPAEAHRLLRKDEVKGKAAALPDDKFGVIYADPPWSYNDKQGGSISESYGAAEKHYPSMSLSELKALDIPSLSHGDCVLWLWATCPLLEDAIELCKAWGFKYKAQFVWDKVGHNMGHYNSVRHELLLVCTRGSMTPENVKLFDSVQVVEKTKRHSEKPEEFRDIINTLYPSANKLELFRRGDAPEGWTAWGNEIEHE